MAKELRRAAIVDGRVKIKTQGKANICFESLTTYAGENTGLSFQLKPDIVMRCGDDDIVIVDTKWKYLQYRSKNLGSSQGDAYQMSAYHRKYSREGNLKEILLVYPRTRDMPFVNELGQFMDQDFVVKVVAYDLLNSQDSAKYILSLI